MTRSLTALLCLAVMSAGCGRRVPPATTAQPVPEATASTTTTTPLPPVLADPIVVPGPPALGDDSVASRSLDDLNRASPLQPVFFGLDSADLDLTARQVVAANAEILKTNATWVVTIEGHCDERGSPEYNLALGERRADAVRAYLLTLGIGPGRIRVVSYGKEFPFDNSHTEAAWAQNRRGHFVITAR